MIIFLRTTRSFIFKKLSLFLTSMLCAWYGLSWPILSMYFSLFCYYLHLEKGVALLLNKLEFPLPRILCAKLDWVWPCGSGDDVENVKSFQTTNRRHADGWTDTQANTKAHFNFRSGKVKRKRFLCLKLYTYKPFKNGSYSHGGEVVERSHRMWDIRVRSPVLTNLLLNHVLTTPLTNVWRQVWVSRVLGDDYYKGLTCVIVWHVKETSLLNEMSAECRSKFVALHW